jgi:hypothetical protein
MKLTEYQRERLYFELCEEFMSRTHQPTLESIRDASDRIGNMLDSIPDEVTL